MYCPNNILLAITIYLSCRYSLQYDMASEAPLTKWKSRSVLITLDEDEENRFIQSAPNLNERDWVSYKYTTC